MSTTLLESEEVVARGTDVVPDIHVYDDVLPDPEGYRALALAHAFQTFEIGGEQWHGFAACLQTDIVDWLRDVRPDLTATLSFLRHSPQGQQEPNFVHTDRGMGDWTALYYLNPSPPDGDGTRGSRMARYTTMVAAATRQGPVQSRRAVSGGVFPLTVAV